MKKFIIKLSTETVGKRNVSVFCFVASLWCECEETLCDIFMGNFIPESDKVCQTAHKNKTEMRKNHLQECKKPT